MACRVELTERQAAAINSDVTQTKYLILTRSSAPVVMPCADVACRNGGHDITDALLAGFRERRVKFRAEHSCRGGIRSGQCGRVLAFVATAEYRRVT